VSPPSPLDTRVLVLTPTPKDFELLSGIFARHFIEGWSCPSLENACAELSIGAGALLVAEEALVNDIALTHWLHRQPPWSDLPILVLVRPGTDSTEMAAATRRLGNVTILERPTRVAALVSAVQSALRARDRQYQIRDHLIEQQRSAAQLRANDQRKDEFLAILAHELRNPLAPISNGLQILNLAYEKDIETAAVRQMMARQLANMKRLVDDLLEVSRVTRGELELRLERAELSAIIKSAIEASQPLITASRHCLEVALPPQPIYLQADIVRLAQVISNLLNNAAKYTHAGGHIALTVERTAEQITIRVIDNGVGISRELQTKIFEIFMQVDASRNRAQGGLGIGLTLVKRLVELHGGSVEVFSGGLGQGSEFVVRLPIRSTVAAANTTAIASGGDLSHLNILIADDNRDAADTLGYLLRGLGALVTVTYGGAEAMAALDLPRTDAAILDIGMQDVDGMQVARRIRAQKGGAAIVLIALTGWGQRQDILDTKDAGFNHHLTKPVDIPQLVSLLADIAVPKSALLS